MAACSDCTKLKPVPFCTDSLVVGTITDLTTAVWIYLRNITTGRTHRVDDTTDGSGTVTLDMTKPGKQFYSPDQPIEITVTLQTATGTEDTKQITVNTTPRDCLLLRTEKIYDDNGDLITYTSITAAEDV